jgi:hypothetical protein
MDSDIERLWVLFYRIASLLRQHWIVLVGNQDAYLGQLDVDGGEVAVAMLRRPGAKVVNAAAAAT